MKPAIGRPVIEFDQRPAALDAGPRFGLGQAEELALAGGQPVGAHPVGRPGVAHAVAMVIAVEEDLEARVRPVPEPARETRTGADRGVAPMVRHDQQRDPLPDVGRHQVEQPIDLVLEPRRDVMDRGQEPPHRPTLPRRRGACQ